MGSEGPMPFLEYLQDISYPDYGLQADGMCDPQPNVAMSVFMILIVIVGLFGNAIVFFVILVLKEYKKSVSNWYVLQLALADTLFLLTLPFTASSELVGSWEFPAWMCKAKEGILMVNYYASIFFLTIMSFDRYMAVTKSGVSPWADVLRRLDSAALISLITWVASICLCIPIFLFSQVDSCKICAYDFPLTPSERCEQVRLVGVECDEWLRKEAEASSNTSSNGYEDDVYTDVLKMMEDHPAIHNQHGVLQAFPNFTMSMDIDDGICRDKGSMFHTWLYLNFSVMLVLPFVLICIFYGIILWTMMGTPSTQSMNQRQYRRRVTLMVLALVTLFAVSWLPWYAVGLARIRGFNLGSRSSCDALSNFTRILSYLNSALNPYFYSFMGSRFHQRFTKARSTATRKSRIFHYLSRVSWHGQDGSHSTSGGNGRCHKSTNEVELKNISCNRKASESDAESYSTKSNLRTERTIVDNQIVISENRRT